MTNFFIYSKAGYQFIWKTAFVIIGCFTLSVPFISHAADTWENVTPSGTSSYTFTTIASMGDYIYAGTDSGIYKSTDAGQSWTAINTGLTNQVISSIAIGWVYNGTDGVYEVNSSSPVFVGTEGGIFKSTIDGTTWTAINTGLTDLVVNDIEIDQYQALAEGAFTNVYAATNSGIYLSTDEGATWTLIDSGMTSLPVQKITSDFNGYIYAISRNAGTSKIFKNDLYSLTFSNDPWSEIYSAAGTTTNDITMLNAVGIVNWISTDKGVLKGEQSWDDWRIRNDGLPTTSVHTIASDYLDSNIAYAVVSGEGIYRTTVEPLDDAEWEWLSINKNLSDLNIIDIKTNPADSNNVFAISESGVYKLTLSDVYVDLTAPSAINDLAVDSVSETQIVLSWTATGDDGVDGNATSYSVRHATSTITAENWSDATALVGQPTPNVSGFAETYTIGTLDTSTARYFAIKVIDEADNESALSNVVITIEEVEDITAPVITGPDVSSISTSGATISWSSDEEATYKILYGTASESYTSSTTSISLDDVHSVALTSLSSNTTYYYVVELTDVEGNTSTSTESTFTTSSVLSGGGGGGSSGGSSSSGSSRSGGGGASSTTNTVTTTTISTNLTEAQLLTVIQSLIKQIQAIAAQRGITIALPTIGETVTPTTFSGTITRDLELNSEGEDVRTLQRYLNSNGYTISTSGAGSPGNETTFFGPATQTSLIRFQQAKGINPSAGYFGPKTKAVTGL